MSIYVTHWPGDKFDIFDDRIFIPQTCLADKVWNWLWNTQPDRRASTYYLILPFWPHHSRPVIVNAYRQLLREGRTSLSPAGRVLYARCVEPPGWFDDPPQTRRGRLTPPPRLAGC